MRNSTKYGIKFLSLLLVTVMLAGMLVFPSAAAEEKSEITWNLLTDKEAGYRVENKHGTWVEDKEADGTPYMYNTNNKSGALYIWDDNNILSTYKTFSLSGDFYFDSFPEGLRDGQYTPEQRPLSFLCWMYGKGENNYQFNALRIDSEGYIHTGANGDKRSEVKLETGKWMNIKCVFTPETGVSEMLIDGEKVLDFMITKFDPEMYTSAAVRYFDGYYNWSAEMKNLLVSSDNNYSVELTRESAADYVGYQTAKPEGDSFDARFLFGVHNTDFGRVGYEITVVSENADGSYEKKQYSDKTYTVYPSVKDASGKTYLARGEFGYKYVAAMELEELPIGEFEIVIRPYVIKNSIRRYGVATRLYYYGDKDTGGYPVFSEKSVQGFTIEVSNDTFIYNESNNRDADKGKEKSLMIRNTGGEKTGLYRAAYFRFDLDADEVEALESAVKATLMVYITGSESNASRKRYEMQIFGTEAAWYENELNFNNREASAARMEKLAQLPYDDATYIMVDVLSYLRKQELNDDGSLSVSFALTQEDGFGDVLMCYASSKEGNFPAMIEVGTSMASGAELNLGKLNNEGYEPWGYAESIVDEWFDELEPKVYPKNEDGTLKEFEIEDLSPEGYDAKTATGDFTYELLWKQGAGWQVHDLASSGSQWDTHRYARTLETLGSSTGNDFLDSTYASENTEFDIYGGITNAGFTGKTTGYFHVEEHEGRQYIIDPLGNPYFAIGINTFVLGDNEKLKNYSLDMYGTKENFFKTITKDMQNAGVSIAYGGDINDVLATEDGLSGVVSIGMVNNYMSSLGLVGGTEAEPYLNNNTINVFDPDYVTFADETARKRITEGGYAENPRVFGYTTDNELPSGADILFRYLSLDPYDPANGFSYATAWTWLARRLDIPSATLDDYLNFSDITTLNSEFLGFLYARMYAVNSAAIDKVDPNHMYLGSRVNNNCRTDAYYLHAAGYYLDILSVNLYGGLNPDAETITNFYRQSGKPFIVTEFFAKGIDSIDANGYRLANSTGAGALVSTQEDRGNYYEHYVMALLESKACVGWTWYRHRDNDQGLYRMPGSDNDLRMYQVDYNKGEAIKYVDENDKILMAEEVGEVTTFYKGEPVLSNQNVNKGFYNADFTSVVTVYTYSNGRLIDTQSYKVQTPGSSTPANGTKIRTLSGDKTFTIGSETSGNITTKTVLTVYEGKYLALMESVTDISNYLMGLVRYFDADMND